MVPTWWWMLFVALVALDVVLVVADAALGRVYPSGLQVWILLQAVLAILGVGALAVSTRDVAYGLVGGLLVAIVLEDWFQVFSPARLRVRSALHDLFPVLGRASDRLSVPDPVDLVIALVGVGAIFLALRTSRPQNRGDIRWLTGFLALWFSFSGLFDLYVDFNYSRTGAFIEETGEAIATSGTLAYLIGAMSMRFGRSVEASGG